MIHTTAFILALPAAGTPTQENKQGFRTAFVTSYKKWALPYVAGITRVLFFSDHKSTQGAAIVELMQRFDVQSDATYDSRTIGQSARGERECFVREVSLTVGRLSAAMAATGACHDGDSRT